MTTRPISRWFSITILAAAWLGLTISANAQNAPANSGPPTAVGLSERQEADAAIGALHTNPEISSSEQKISEVPGVNRYG
jgi:hypothetical protein